MNWKLPNQLTVARVVLAMVFFVLLGFYDPNKASGPIYLNIAFVTYLIAAITDVLDGYLARKWNLVSAFGRIVDPFVDKLLVLGAFIMLCGKNFTGETIAGVPEWVSGGMLSGIQTWMVVIILSREFIVSAIRGYAESQGIAFPATRVGKAKMLIQSITICVILFQLANVNNAVWAVWFRQVWVWLAVVTTILSGFGYIRYSKKALMSSDESKNK